MRRKNGQESVTYAHDRFRAALEPTFGVLVYQEQVMRISKDVCGFSGGDADTLRKAIGKKKRDVMDKMRKKFIEGGETYGGVPKEVMEKFWKDLLGFADYAFNKSHSACYGLIAYQTAYLKANYPSAFMAALMTSDFDDTDRLTIEMSECQNMGIEVLPPDVNESFLEFAVVPGKEQIRFGMSAIKNVGKGAVEEILRARGDGLFASLEDFFTRVNGRIVNKKTIESLIKTGAFDRFESRSVLMNNIEALLAFSHKKQKEQDSGQTDLFGEVVESVTVDASITLGPEDTTYSTKDYLTWERELMGLFLSAHPLMEYKQFFEEQGHPINSISATHSGSKVTVGGLIIACKVIQTKNNQSMAFVRLADESSEIELLLFPKTYEETSWLWVQDKVVLVQGKVDATDKDGNATDELKVIVSTAREVTHDEAINYVAGKKKPKTIVSAVDKKSTTKQKKTERAIPKRIYIRLEDTSNTQQLMDLKRHVSGNPGEAEVVLVVGTTENRKAIRIPDLSSDTDESIAMLHVLFGAENVKYE